MDARNVFFFFFLHETHCCVHNSMNFKKNVVTLILLGTHYVHTSTSIRKMKIISWNHGLSMTHICSSVGCRTLCLTTHKSLFYKTSPGTAAWFPALKVHISYKPARLIWSGHAITWFMPYANNKGADQPAHPCSPISAFCCSLPG